MGLSGGKLVHRQQIDTFISASNGATIDVSTIPLKCFSLVVAATGPVTSWDIVLEGSINGTNYTTILNHTDTIGNGETVFSGVLTSPVLYFRTRCQSIVLGSGTNVVVTVLGAQ